MTTLSLQDYTIYIGDDNWMNLQNYLQVQSYASIIVLMDENTHEHCWPILQPILQSVPKVYTIQITSGERNKTLSTCQAIWEAMMQHKTTRRSLMLNLGGGVIGDMGGFCASTFKRGIDFIQIPTTLLSQVDASIGGKLGIDFGDIKNSIGLFRNPNLVYINPLFLKTLPKREIRSGFAEIIKHSLIASQEQWIDIQKIESLDSIVWSAYITPSLSIKQRIVEQDPFEKGIRKALNFGHTIGHAVESHFLHSDSPLLHGEAIAIGMICESYLSFRLVGLSEKALERITHFMLRIYGHVSLQEKDFEIFTQLMTQDKKNDNHQINFTLLKNEGEAIINQTADVDLIRESLSYYVKAQMSIG